jgi:hypothetical protein
LEVSLYLSHPFRTAANQPALLFDRQACCLIDSRVGLLPTSHLAARHPLIRTEGPPAPAQVRRYFHNPIRSLDCSGCSFACHCSPRLHTLTCVPVKVLPGPKYGSSCCFQLRGSRAVILRRDVLRMWRERDRTGELTTLPYWMLGVLAYRLTARTVQFCNFEVGTRHARISQPSALHS